MMMKTMRGNADTLSQNRASLFAVSHQYPTRLRKISHA
jgi:hypothetical protein